MELASLVKLALEEQPEPLCLLDASRIFRIRPMLAAMARSWFRGRSACACSLLESILPNADCDASCAEEACAWA